MVVQNPMAAAHVHVAVDLQCIAIYMSTDGLFHYNIVSFKGIAVCILALQCPCLNLGRKGNRKFILSGLGMT